MTAEFTPWPCTSLSQYPLSEDWTDTFPAESLSRYHYIHIKNVTHTFFLEPTMTKTYAMLRDYAFQQGDMSNANPLDMEFFHNILTHDYPFFMGHKKTEIQSAFDLSAKKFQGMGHLKSSHFDLWRVENATLGFAQLQSLTNPGKINAFVSLTEMPKKGDILFARTLPIGLLGQIMMHTVVEPWDTVMPEHVDSILATFQMQFNAFKNKFPHTTSRAFMKIAAYHFYELIQSKDLIPILNDKLKPVKDTVLAQNISFIFPDIKAMPKLSDIPGAKRLKDEDGNWLDLATASICEDLSVPETLREAIISKENRTLEVTMFMKDAAEAYITQTLEPLFGKAKVIRKTHLLDDNETYRALRHLSLPPRPLF
ncbi:MAG: hypothetical protein J6S69_07035 [Proteobacteria bacterium]|nr:hypothetical protein [Pseudomonadota bacterium]